jgi:hypothetical protein
VRNELILSIKKSLEKMGEAKIFASKILRTNVHHRPYPSLFFYPGLNTHPFYNPTDFKFTKDFEENYHYIKQEYFQIKKHYGKEDYSKLQDEHVLEEGEWSWMNYI